METHPSGIKPESWIVSAGRASEPGAPLNVPPVPASNFILGTGRAYSRGEGTPTWEALEEVVGGLETGRAVAFASGMAAVAAVFDQLPAGAVVVLPEFANHLSHWRDREHARGGAAWAMPSRRSRPSWPEWAFGERSDMAWTGCSEQSRCSL